MPRLIRQANTAEQKALGERLALLAWERARDATDPEACEALGAAIREAREQRWTWALIGDWTGCDRDTAPKYALGVPATRKDGNGALAAIVRGRGTLL